MLKGQVYIVVVISALIICFQKNDLYSSKITGTIEKLSYPIGKQGSKNYTILKINNKEYRLSILSASGNEFSFMDVARNGDTVFKAKNSDTLFVIRRGFNDNVHFSFIVKEYISK